MQRKEQPRVFRIGIAMAGAVSAGAYTAGVIDYLLESLSRWEKAKEENKKALEKLREEEAKPEESQDKELIRKLQGEHDASVPMHDVIIEVIGGSSAGGMTAAITTLSLFEGIRPVNDVENPQKEGNKLYSSWVGLNDDIEGKGPTLHQMLSTDDIAEGQGVVSFLNSRPIDAIAERAMALERIQANLPDYISKELEVILTITSLRGIPLAINFFDEEKKESQEEPPRPAHMMNLHKGVAHFRLQTRDDGNLDPEGPMPFNPRHEAHRRALLDAAIATGAFPLGLAPRHITNIPKSYLEGMIKRMFINEQKHSDESYRQLASSHLLRIDIKDDFFNFFAVDGGTVNNEPFGEVIKALEAKCKAGEGTDSNYAILMIDPFPNFEKEPEKDEQKTPTILDLAPRLIGAIRGQAMIKESDLAEGLTSDHNLRMIFPSRRYKEVNEQGETVEKKDPYPISCGSLDGFGGFFSREFREHDFQLGRKNCQSFLRNYFCIPIEKARKMDVFEGWQENDDRHKRFFSEAVRGYPIIPDMTYYPESYASDMARKYEDYTLSSPDKGAISVEEIFALEEKIRHRAKTVLLNLLPRKDAKAAEARESLASSPEGPENAEAFAAQSRAQRMEEIKAEVDALIGQRYKQSLGEILVGRVLADIGKQLWNRVLADKAASLLSRQVIRAILIDFKMRRLIPESGEKIMGKPEKSPPSGQ